MIQAQTQLVSWAGWKENPYCQRCRRSAVPRPCAAQRLPPSPFGGVCRAGRRRTLPTAQHAVPGRADPLPLPQLPGETRGLEEASPTDKPPPTAEGCGRFLSSCPRAQQRHQLQLRPMFGKTQPGPQEESAGASAQCWNNSLPSEVSGSSYFQSIKTRCCAALHLARRQIPPGSAARKEPVRR